MELVLIAMAGGTMLALASLSGYLLGLANKVFHVEVDPRIDAINAALPGANCGGCGFVGCMPYAEAVAEGKAPPDKCTVGGASVIEAVAGIMGVEVKPSWPYRPVVHCRAHTNDKFGRAEYRGEQTCAAANIVGSIQGCAYGCLALSDCVRSCDYNAIHIVDGLATVDYEKCVGCGACARACPRNIISMTPFKRGKMLAVACSNKDFGKDVKAVCKVGCIGCTACSRTSDIFKMEGKIARIDYDKYDPDQLESARVALNKCPARAIVEIGEPTPEDLAKVEDEEAPAIAQADFKTTVDQTEWHG